MAFKSLCQLGEEPDLPCYFQLRGTVPLPLFYTSVWRQVATKVSGKQRHFKNESK